MNGRPDEAASSVVKMFFKNWSTDAWCKEKDAIELLHVSIVFKVQYIAYMYTCTVHVHANVV